MSYSEQGMGARVFVCTREHRLSSQTWRDEFKNTTEALLTKRLSKSGILITNKSVFLFSVWNIHLNCLYLAKCSDINLPPTQLGQFEPLKSVRTESVGVELRKAQSVSLFTNPGPYLLPWLYQYSHYRCALCSPKSLSLHRLLLTLNWLDQRKSDIVLI